MRVWLYDTLASDPALLDFVDDDDPTTQPRIFPRESLGSSVVPKPYIVYGLGTNTNEQLAEDDDHEADRQFFQIWIHDEGGDYTQIDDMIEVVKDLLRNASSKADNVIMVRWLETSQEFSDQTMNTIFRYIRFQAIRARGAFA